MNFEKVFLALAQKALSGILIGGLFFAKAEETAAEPFGVLHTITAGGAREARVLHPLMQLDVFAPDQFSATEKAEAVCAAIENLSGGDGLSFLGGTRVERTQPLECQDGSWKVPVNIKFSVIGS